LYNIFENMFMTIKYILDVNNLEKIVLDLLFMKTKNLTRFIDFYPIYNNEGFFSIFYYK
jgi:hypothetical protein